VRYHTPSCKYQASAPQAAQSSCAFQTSAVGFANQNAKKGINMHCFSIRRAQQRPVSSAKAPHCLVRPRLIQAPSQHESCGKRGWLSIHSNRRATSSGAVCRRMAFHTNTGGGQEVATSNIGQSQHRACVRGRRLCLLIVESSSHHCGTPKPWATLRRLLSPPQPPPSHSQMRHHISSVPQNAGGSGDNAPRATCASPQQRRNSLHTEPPREAGDWVCS
jgi:hypothetical protein